MCLGAAKCRARETSLLPTPPPFLTPQTTLNSSPILLVADIETYEAAQCRRFREAGCSITALRVTKNGIFSAAKMAEVVMEADAVLVSGGNTLYAVQRWKAIGLDKLLAAAAGRGCVMTGGSAGAICWFTAGHSDSADPDSYYPAMMKDTAESKDESSVLGETAKPWKYIRVPCLGILPGFVLPHADKVQVRRDWCEERSTNTIFYRCCFLVANTPPRR